jgi:hypothetical protein
MRHSLERVYDLSSLSQLRPAFGAGLHVRDQRRNAESGLAVEKLIDFVW